MSYSPGEVNFTVYAVVLKCLECDSIHSLDSIFCSRGDAEKRVKHFDDDRENEFLAEIQLKVCQ